MVYARHRSFGRPRARAVPRQDCRRHPPPIKPAHLQRRIHLVPLCVSRRPQVSTEPELNHRKVLLIQRLQLRQYSTLPPSTQLSGRRTADEGQTRIGRAHPAARFICGVSTPRCGFRRRAPARGRALLLERKGHSSSRTGQCPVRSICRSAGHRPPAEPCTPLRPGALALNLSLPYSQRSAMRSSSCCTSSGKGAGWCCINAAVFSRRRSEKCLAPSWTHVS